MKQFALLLAFVIALMSTVSAFAGEVVVSTGTTFIDKIFNPVKPQLKNLGVSAKILFGDPVEALKNLEAGNAELAGASLAFEDWLKQAEAKGYTVKDKSSLVPHVIVEEETVVLVNASNSVTTLSKEQLQGLFTGSISNWKEVGGKDMPVLIVWPRVSSGGTVTFMKQIMGNKVVSKEVLDVAAINETAHAVASNPEAVSIGNIENITTGSKRVATPPVKRPLILLSKGAPSADSKKLLDFLKSPEAMKNFK